MPASARDSIRPTAACASCASARISCAPSRRAIFARTPRAAPTRRTWCWRLRAPGGPEPHAGRPAPTRDEVYQFETGRRPASNRRERPRDAGRTVALPSSRDRGSSRGSDRDDQTGSTRSGRSGLGGSSARTGKNGPAAPVHQPRPGPAGPGHRGEHRLVLAAHHRGRHHRGPARRDRPGLWKPRSAGKAMCPRCHRHADPAAPIPGAANEGGTDATRLPQPVAPTSASSATTCPRAQSVIEVVQDGKTVEAVMSPGPWGDSARTDAEVRAFR